MHSRSVFRATAGRIGKMLVCEAHDPTGEPNAGNPHVGFGERRLETEPRRGVRHRHRESRRQQLPPHRPTATAPVVDSTAIGKGFTEWTFCRTAAGNSCAPPWRPAMNAPRDGLLEAAFGCGRVNPCLSVILFEATVVPFAFVAATIGGNQDPTVVRFSGAPLAPVAVSVSPSE